MKKSIFASLIISVCTLTISCDGGKALGGLLTNENATNIATDVIGSLLSGNNTSAASIVGTWNYNEPAIQLESDNILGQIGGSVLNSSIEKKIKTYYEKLGIKKNAFSFTFNKDGSCSYTLKGQKFDGTYQFDQSTNKIKITTAGILSFPSAYARVSGNQLELTFDATNLLNLGTSLASGSGNSALGAVGEIAKSYSGLKAGFNFTK